MPSPSPEPLPTAIHATACSFSRSAIAPLEYGIAISREPGSYNVLVIVDMTGQVVTQEDLYHYSLLNYEGCFTFINPEFRP